MIEAKVGLVINLKLLISTFTKIQIFRKSGIALRVKQHGLDPFLHFDLIHIEKWKHQNMQHTFLLAATSLKFQIAIGS